MMQHARAPVQEADAPPHPPRGQPRISTNNLFVPIRAHADQEIGTTASRRTRRGDFLRAATWAITEGLHPKAGDTTLRVARDLAARLNADGQVAYCRETMWRRLGISRRTLEHLPAEPAAPDPPGFVIRDRILASLAEAERAWRARTPETCRTLAEWEAVCDARERSPW